jgi:hypothetical protein
MKCRNDKFEINLAKPEDAAQLLRIYECGDFKGNISVLYTRRPDPFKSLLLEGEKVVVPTVTNKENNVIVGMGVCIIRKAYINGEIKNTGYLTGLKGLPEYRKRVPSISEVYKYLHELTKDDVDIYYTTILKENESVQKMLEKKRKNMPEYKRMGEYTVYCFKTGTSVKENGYTLRMGNIRELERQYNGGPGSFNFSPVNVNLHGLTDEDIYILRDHNGEAVASCAVWNQQSYKQYVITEYRAVYRYLKRLPLKLTGYPNLPRENIPANYGSIALLTVKGNDPVLAEKFIRKVAEKVDNYDFLMLGLFENHPYTGSMDRIKCIKYQSRLYTVHWEDNYLVPDNRPLNLEVGLL